MPSHPSSIYLLLFETVNGKDAPLPLMLISTCAHTKDLSTDVDIGDLALFMCIQRPITNKVYSGLFPQPGK